MNSKEFRTLYAYNRWANQRVLDACRPVETSTLTRNLGNSFSSIRDTLAHILGAEWVWLERWQHRSPRQFPDLAGLVDLEAVEKRWSDVERDRQVFLGNLKDEQLGERIRYKNFKGEEWEYSLSQMMQHLVNHSTYHRGQVITLLKQVGAKTVSTDLLLYFDSVPGSSV